MDNGIHNSFFKDISIAQNKIDEYNMRYIDQERKIIEEKVVREEEEKYRFKEVRHGAGLCSGQGRYWLRPRAAVPAARVLSGARSRQPRSADADGRLHRSPREVSEGWYPEAGRRAQLPDQRRDGIVGPEHGRAGARLPQGPGPDHAGVQGQDARQRQ